MKRGDLSANASRSEGWRGEKSLSDEDEHDEDGATTRPIQVGQSFTR